MLAVIVNAVAVIVGGTLGILCRNRLKESLQKALIRAMGLCTVLIGIQSAVGTEDILCVIICMALGTTLGELLDIDSAIDRGGNRLKSLVIRGGTGESRFTEGFLTASILFCIGPMTIMGSLEAGISHDYSIILAKSAIDLVSAMAFSAAMGVGVLFSSLFVFVFQGALTLLSGAIGAAFSTAAVTEMSAVGGLMLIGMAINLLELGHERIRAANMIPALFLPLLYLPVSAWLGGLFV